MSSWGLLILAAVLFLIWYVGSAFTVGYLYLLEGRETRLGGWLTSLFPGSVRAAQQARERGDPERLRWADTRVRKSLRRLRTMIQWIVGPSVLVALLILLVWWLTT